MRRELVSLPYLIRVGFYMRKNVWIGLLVAGSTIAVTGATFLTSGVLLMWTLAPLLVGLPPNPIFFWFQYGFVIAGVVITIPGLILIIAGYLRYRREREYDIQMGLKKA